MEDNVQIGPRVNLIIENQPVDPSARKDFDLKSILIKRNVWIGAEVTILPGVNVRKNSIVAAGHWLIKMFPPIPLIVGCLLKLSGQSIKNYLKNLTGQIAMFARVSYLRST